MDENLKAVEEVAKTAGKAIDAAVKVGSFISKFTTGSIELGMGIFEDKLKYIRWERQLRLMSRADELMKSNGINEPNKPIKLKFGIPLLQAATLEEDDYLQDLWAKLIVNSSNEESNVELTRTYIDILERLTVLEAKILETLYSLPFEQTQHAGIVTKYLPERAEIAKEGEEIKLENEDILLALAELTRLGCINPLRTLGGGEVFSRINPTLLGKYFVAACTLKK